MVPRCPRFPASVSQRYGLPGSAGLLKSAGRTVGKHVASDHCSLRVENGRDAVRMTVADATEELPVLREPDHLAESGRGMRLITRVADAWGVRVVHRGGKEVWVELREPASSVPAAG